MSLYDAELADDAAEDAEQYEPPAGVVEVAAMLRRLQALDARAADVAAVRAAETRRITEWANEQMRVVDNARRRLSELIEGWARADNARTGTKTWNLPAGQVRVRPDRPKVDVFDAEVFRAWCIENGVEEELWRPRDPEPDKVAIGKHFEVGPELPGATPAEASYGLVEPDTALLPPGVRFRRHPTGLSFGLTVRPPEPPPEG